MFVCTTQKSVFKELNGFPYKKACFPRNAIRVALLYSGFMSTSIKAIRIQNSAVYLSSARVRFFGEILDLGFQSIHYKCDQKRNSFIHFVTLQEPCLFKQMKERSNPEANAAKIHGCSQHLKPV